MARIIKEVPRVEHRCVCGGCGSTVAYTKGEVQLYLYHGTDMSGGPDGCEWINCPGCSAQIILRSWLPRVRSATLSRK